MSAGMESCNNDSKTQRRTNILSNYEEFAQNTPEYIHPRKDIKIQWLMSPPVLEQTDNKMESQDNRVPECVRPRLLRPDDFICNWRKEVDTSHLPFSESSKLQSFGNLSNLEANTSECAKYSITHPTSLCSDSGISSPDTQQSDVELLDRVYLMCRDCENFTEFLSKLKDMMSQKACDSLLSLLFSVSHCSKLHHQCHLCLLTKLISSQDSETNAAISSSNRQFPIAVFWDIENCQVPTGKSAFDIAQKIRKSFFSDHQEAEFMAVCDINKETKQVVQDLNNAQVNVIHINATAKNAADDKLRQSIRRYAHSYTAPATIVLITSDCNFASEVSDLRHRHNFFVILLHNTRTSDCLKQAAHTSVLYEEFVKDLAIVYPYLPSDAPTKYHLYVSNLPRDEDARGIRCLLKQLSSNCGGKVLSVMPPFATLRFTTQELADRALIRLNGEEVFNSKIVVQRNKSADVDSSTSHQKLSPKSSLNNLAALHKVPQGCEVKKPTRRLRSKRPSATDAKTQQRSECSQVVQQKTENSKASSADQPISISITNIDAQLGNEMIRSSITKLVSQHCDVLQFQIRPHNRFTVTCDIAVPRKQDALAVLADLHRKRLGSKRILVMISSNNQFSLNLFKNEIIPLLLQFHDIGCPFHELATSYNERYHKILKVSQLQLISDVVSLEDASNGLIVYPNLEKVKKMYFSCPTHHKCQKKADKDVIINIPLSEFSSKIHLLLLLHNGLLYFNSLEECYETEYGSFPYAKTPDEGVHLEHELSYVPGIVVVSGHVKVITWMQRKNDFGVELPVVSRLMTSQMSRFTKEVIEYLKTYPHSSIFLSKFKLIYLEKFADYYSVYHLEQVVDVLNTIPHVIQVGPIIISFPEIQCDDLLREIVGSPGSELVVLSHRAQVKRFTSELIKMLKSQSDKTLAVSQLPDIYEKVIGQVWNLYNYGVNSITDLLDDIPDSTVCVTNDVISLPVRERSEEEVTRTAQFAWELVEILKLKPQYRVPFKDFIPAYHRQYGRQCRLIKFGFNKLSDLFESLPQVVQVVESANEKYLQLSTGEKLKALTCQLVALLCDGDGGSMGVPLLRLQAMFTRKYGRPLTPLDYDCDSIEALMKLLPHAIQIFTSEDGALMIRQSERKPIRLLSVQLLVLLLDIEDQQLKLERLHQVYIDRYKEEVTAMQYGYTTLELVVRKALSGIAKVELDGADFNVLLKPIYKRAKRIRNILLQNGGSMTLGEFNRSYREKYKEGLDTERFGFSTCEAMLRAIPLVVSVKGFGIKKTVLLRNHMHYGPLSGSVGSNPPTSKSSQSTTFQPSLSSLPPLPTVTDVESAIFSTAEHSKNEARRACSPKNFSSGFPPAPSLVSSASLSSFSYVTPPLPKTDFYLSYQHYRRLQIYCNASSSQVLSIYPNL